MNKQHFHTLLTRFRNGTSSERENRLVEQWFSMLDADGLPLNEAESKALEEKLWKAISSKQRMEAKQVKFIRYPWRWAAAAMLVLATTWGVYRFAKPGSLQTGEPVAVNERVFTEQKTNDSAKDEKVVLPDGSEVTLSPSSTIRYARNFEGNQREVFLKGRAFFQVVKNANKPFLVQTGAVVTKVLGTSFWVEGSEVDLPVEVSVVSGKVAITRMMDVKESEPGKVKGGVILTTNQKVRFSADNQTFETGLVEQPVLVETFRKSSAKEAISFVFEDHSIEDVIRELEKAYGIEIILENEALKTCLFSGDISQHSLFTKLEMVCSSVNADYVVRGTRVLVSGKGCAQ